MESKSYRKRKKKMNQNEKQKKQQNETTPFWLKSGKRKVERFDRNGDK